MAKTVAVVINDDLADIIVGGKRIEPAKITAAGYRFRFPDVEPALRHSRDQEPVT
jgi:NAD dependent epimerase/dehydratase family enzyme